MTSRRRRLLFGSTMCLATATIALSNLGSGAETALRDPPAKPGVPPISGRELFLREWIPNDPRSHGGDGLGPVFNDTSCVSCHNQGGIGGGGAEAKNVVVITAFLVNPIDINQNGSAPAAAARQQARTLPEPDDIAPGLSKEQAQLDHQKKERQELIEELRKLHPGLAAARSVVLHKSGTDPEYAAWRDQVLGFGSIFPSPQTAATDSVNEHSGSGFFGALLQRVEREKARELRPPHELQMEKMRGLAASIPAFAFAGDQRNGRKLAAVPSQRNATALFGAGRIDSIPDKVLEAAAALKHPDYPEISGRVARLKDGKIGRFGWKAQKASLHDFTMTACAVELGLNVPDHPQAGAPQSPDYQPTGFDLNQDECLALVQFLKDLPDPAHDDGAVPAIAAEVSMGEKLFATIGCAACHQTDLGEVRGIYSDLLLHDLGPENGDSGSYGVFQPKSSGNDADDPLAGLVGDKPQNQFASFIAGDSNDAKPGEEQIPAKMIGAGRQEWRTPPLWGVRDSAPYLHDGRAKSLEQAIAFHGGEAQLSANRFYRLKPEERSQVLTFLRTLVAPSADVASR